MTSLRIAISFLFFTIQKSCLIGVFRLQVPGLHTFFFSCCRRGDITFKWYLMLSQFLKTRQLETTCSFRTFRIHCTSSCVHLLVLEAQTLTTALMFNASAVCLPVDVHQYFKSLLAVITSRPTIPDSNHHDLHSSDWKWHIESTKTILYVWDHEVIKHAWCVEQLPYSLEFIYTSPTRHFRFSFSFCEEGLAILFDHY